MIRRQLLLFWATALTVGCTTVELKDPPSDVNACRPSQIFFVEHVWPDFLARDFSGQTCGDASCHGDAGGRPFRAVMPTSAPSYPFPPQSDWDKSYLSATQQMICTNVRDSELYARPAGLRKHGAKLIEPDGPEAQLLQIWVTASP